ncbi:MAG: peptidoglycan DD-metalloendopeptidase family protein [Oscillospiraceae bacterium]|nr:peptidoglycan DD-metalloendopeptidase family protein [Oscillospiraceae bacterium]
MHRKQRISTTRIVSFFMEYIGDLLYYLGLSIEREYKNTLRSLRRGTKKVFFTIGRFFAFIFRTLGRFLLTVILDFLNPFIKSARSLKSLSKLLRIESKKGIKAYFRRIGYFIKYGWIWNKHLLVRFFNQFIPVVSIALFIFVISYINNLNFALLVRYEGENIGYVDSEQIFDSATVIIRERMVESNDMGWTSNIKLSIAVVPEDDVLSNRNVADNMLMASGVGVSQATGLYIDNMFYGATTEGASLEETLDGLLEAERKKSKEEHVSVTFANNIELREGVYPESSIQPIEVLDEFINSDRTQAVFYSVGVEDTIDDILLRCLISYDTLQMLNKDVNLADLHEGQKLLISQQEPMLPIRVSRIEVVVEEIPIEVEEYLDPLRSSDFSYVYIIGEAGLREVYYEVTFDDGVEISRTVSEVNVIADMIKKVVVKGTRVNAGFGGRPPTTSGILGWPTGSYQKISRGTEGTSHIAVDIAAVTGTNVFAAASGTVTEVTWSDYGYGYYVTIDHGIIDGVHLSTLYAHCSELLVEVGQFVERGELVAYSGSTGNSTGPHLHFEVRVNGEKTPPEPWIGMQ